MELLDRVKTRLPDENRVSDIFLMEVIETIEDRLNLRLGTEKIPKQFNSIVVDAVIKMYRRQYYEGIESERIDMIQTKFIEDVLSEYDLEIKTYIDNEKVKKINLVSFI